MQKIIPITSIVLIIAIITYLGFTYENSKNAYININGVYNEFEMKKELEQQLIKVQNKRKAILDSLVLTLKIRANQLSENENVDLIDQQEFELLQRNYMEKEETFSSDNQRVSMEYEKKITTRMTEYIKEYGEIHQYDYLFGAGGQGNIMYAKEKNDITKEVIKYINKRYSGNN